MTTLTSKFSLGQKVWYAGTKKENRHMPCPDCNDAREWKVTSPAGGEYAFPCPRCAAAYHGDSRLSLYYAWFVPNVVQLTIGQIKLSNDSNCPEEYMCNETGVGSGTLYQLDVLFDTRDAAETAAQVRADAINSSAGYYLVKRYDALLQVCDYQLKDAQGRLSEEEAHRAACKLNDLVAMISDVRSIEEVKSILTIFKEE